MSALWTTAPQPPLSMGFSGEEYWSGLPCPPPGDPPNPGIKPRSPALEADFYYLSHQGSLLKISKSVQLMLRSNVNEQAVKDIHES